MYNNLFEESIYKMEGIDDDSKKAIIDIRNRCCSPIQMEAHFVGVAFTIAMLAWGLYDIGSMVAGWITGKSDDSDKKDDESEDKSNDDNESFIESMKSYKRALKVAYDTPGDLDTKIKAVLIDKILPGKDITDYSDKGFALNEDGTISIKDEEKFRNALKEETGLTLEGTPSLGEKAKGEQTLAKLKDNGMDVKQLPSLAYLLMSEEDVEYAMEQSEPSFFDSMKEKLSLAGDGLSSVWTSVKEGANDLYDDVAPTASAAWNKTKELGSSAIDHAKEVGSYVADKAESIVEKAKKEYACSPEEFPDPSIDVIEGYKKSSKKVKNQMRGGFYRNEKGEIARMPRDKYARLLTYTKQEDEENRAKVDKVNRDMRIWNGRVATNQMSNYEKKLLTGERKVGDDWKKKEEPNSTSEDKASNA